VLELIVGFTLNGEETTVRVVTPVSLLDALRDQLGLVGVKSACQQGECGSCSVVLDGAVVCSCLVMAADAEGSRVVTVEGIPEGSVHDALERGGAVQCGFCTPGIVVSATELFASNPAPTVEEIKDSLAGNICRCTGYGAIVRSLVELSRSGE
jgi:carbon-monoxide dehydrogenase small subunit